MDSTSQSRSDNAGRSAGDIEEKSTAITAPLMGAPRGAATQSQNNFSRNWIKRAALIAAFCSAIVLVNQLLWFSEINSLWMLRLGFAAGVASLLYCVVSGQWHRWIAPRDRLAELIREIHCGNAPVEELTTVGGGLEGVAREVKALLLESRDFKRQMAQLDLEIRHRVANRTDALERMIGSLRNQANRDPLTGLFNRRMLDQVMPQIVRECLGQGTPLAMQMIDVDYFKDLNDTLGHATGDQMLRALGQIIRSTIRTSDYGFRFGGDEFVILMPGCDRESALRIAERLQSLAAALGKSYQLARNPALSIGVSTLAELHDPTPEDLLKRADVQLYEQKLLRKEALRPVAVGNPIRKKAV
jgi:diguanylate cyclase (GGDEF)-like protein